MPATRSTSPTRPSRAGSPAAVADVPGPDVPGMDTPSSDTPGSDTPGSDTPGGDTPGSDTPGMDTPGTDAPAEALTLTPADAPAAGDKTKAPRRSRRGRTAGPSIPLGSLTQLEHRAVIHCQGCGSTRVTRLAMNLTDGTPVEFTSCHRCEHRTWETAGDTLSVDTVLDRTRRD